MSDLQRLQASIDVHEDFKADPYKDSKGLWSGATGLCLETNPLTGTEWAHLLENKLITIQFTKAGADWLRDMKIFGIEVWFAKTFPWWPKMNDARQNGFLEMAFQLGIGKLPAFHDLLAAAAAGDGEEMARQVELNGAGDGPSSWMKETPVRAKYVAHLFRTGSFGV